MRVLPIYRHTPFLFALLLTIIYSCDEKNSDAPLDRGGHKDTSIYLADISSADTINVYIGGNCETIIDEKIFPLESPLRPIVRIPTIVISNNGTMLVAAENRANALDLGQIDIVLSRKADCDHSWKVSRVWSHDSLSYGRSMNPIFAVDRIGASGYAGRIYLFTCHIKHEVALANEAETNQVDFVYKYSDDDGVSWSEETSIKDFWDLSKYSAVIPSAANGIQLDDGTLVIPTMVIKERGWRSGIVYSKPPMYDNWVFSNSTPCYGDNECTVYIDKQDQLILDCRTTELVRHKYKYDFNNDTWSPIEGSFTYNINLKAEISKCLINDQDLYLMSFCDTPDEVRQNITLFASNDGIIWNKVYRLQEGPCHFGYSNVAVWDNKIAITYETYLSGTRVQEISNLSTYILKAVK